MNNFIKIRYCHHSVFDSFEEMYLNKNHIVFIKKINQPRKKDVVILQLYLTNDITIYTDIRHLEELMNDL